MAEDVIPRKTVEQQAARIGFGALQELEADGATGPASGLTVGLSAGVWFLCGTNRASAIGTVENSPLHSSTELHLRRKGEMRFQSVAFGLEVAEAGAEL